MTLTVQKFFLLINQMSSTKYLCIFIAFLKVNSSESIFLIVNYPKAKEVFHIVKLETNILGLNVLNSVWFLRYIFGNLRPERYDPRLINLYS